VVGARPRIQIPVEAMSHKANAKEQCKNVKGRKRHILDRLCDHNMYVEVQYRLAYNIEPIDLFFQLHLHKE
jgi:hypothetical protein